MAQIPKTKHEIHAELTKEIIKLCDKYRKQLPNLLVEWEGGEIFTRFDGIREQNIKRTIKITHTV